MLMSTFTARERSTGRLVAQTTAIGLGIDVARDFDRRFAGSWLDVDRFEIRVARERKPDDWAIPDLDA